MFDKPISVVFKHCVIAAALATMGGANANPADSGKDKNGQNAGTAGLVVATWNVEHLASPVTAGCRPRTEEEITALKAYADSLDADIVGLQEVGSAAAAHLLFPADEWQVVMSGRPDNEPFECRQNGAPSTQQKVAYAVRKGIKILETDYRDEFGLDSRGLRYGLEITVDSELGKLSLLNLHMKSGCFVDNYSRSDSEACEIFKKQTPLLDAWIEEHEKSGEPYVVLGDFNHRLSATYNHLTRELSSNSDGSDSTMEILTKDMLGCHPWYPAPIDHVIVGNLKGKDMKKSVTNHHYDNMEPDAMLADHCAISATIANSPLPITNAVKWLRKSAEYDYVTLAAYKEAEEYLQKSDKPKGSWVVVMDVDETILDNSQYQVERDNTGTSYSSATWGEWVEREDATLVPGAKAFMKAVIAKGGKLALVTNRPRPMDDHTWTNLLEVGIPLTAENTCLMGRSAEDKTAMGSDGVINDKDLRRQQIRNGSASCYDPAGGRHSKFGEHAIHMQVGDNIEDFEGILQHDVDVLKLLESTEGDLVLLPNPMYGSWR